MSTVQVQTLSGIASSCSGCRRDGLGIGNPLPPKLQWVGLPLLYTFIDFVLFLMLLLKVLHEGIYEKIPLWIWISGTCIKSTK